MQKKNAFSAIFLTVYVVYGFFRACPQKRIGFGKRESPLAEKKRYVWVTQLPHMQHRIITAIKMMIQVLSSEKTLPKQLIVILLPLRLLLVLYVGEGSLVRRLFEI